jgi:alanyl-tRNA synthetase
MPTHKRFWDDPYLAQMEARVAVVDGCEVALDATIFFALSGGQESDQGSIGGFPVLQATKGATDIWYTLPEGHTVCAGQTVEVEIDWARRYQLMCLHFAAELVLELVYRQLPGIEKIGAHISQDKARIDFSLPESIAKYLPDIAAAANAVVVANLPIVTGFEDSASERRYWMIEGFSRVPCGGTHVRRTGEVGTISLKRKNIGKNKERIEISVGAADEGFHRNPTTGEDLGRVQTGG